MARKKMTPEEHARRRYESSRAVAVTIAADKSHYGDLHVRNLDRADFREIHVESFRSALEATYDAGSRDAATRLRVLLRDAADIAAEPGRNPFLREIIADAIAEAGRLAGEA